MKKLLILLLLVSACLGYMPSMVSFNNGQVSPMMEARTDYQKYGSSLRTAENVLLTPQGPIIRRPGTKYIAEVKDSSNAVRLIPFEYSTDDAYVIEMGNLYARFYRNGGQVLTSSGTEDISALDNIIAHWTLNDDTSNTAVVDDDGATHNGIATANTEDISITAKNSKGFNLDTTYAVSVTDHADFTFVEGVDGDFSLSGWAYITEQSNEQVLISKWYEGNAREWKLSLDTSQKLKMSIADESILLDTDLIAQWKLNDSAATATVIDALGNNNGALTDGSNDYTSDHSVAGKVNNAMDMDGTNDKITIDDDAVFSFGDSINDSPFSISAWVNMDDATEFAVISKRNANNGEYEFGVGSDDKLYIRLHDNDKNVYIGRKYNTAITAYQTGGGSAGWIHVVMTYDATEASSGITLYLNGTAVDDVDFQTGSYTAMHNLTQDVVIGFVDRFGSDEYANGRIDNVMIFDKELSQVEVTALNNSDSGIEELDAQYISSLTDDALSTGWHYIAMTYNQDISWTGATAADYIDLYVDAVDVDQTASNLSTYVTMEATSALVRIGAEYSSAGAIDNIWADKLDNIAVFGDVLAPSEISAMFSDTSIYELVTPYLTADLNGIQYVQSDNELYIVHNSHEPRKLNRIQHDEWTISTLDIETGPFITENTDIALTITPSATTGTVTLTASDLLFKSGHIGSIWQIRQPRDTSVFEGSLSSNTNGTATPSFTGNYSFTTEGTWTATVTLQRSTDDGTTWENALSPLVDTNFDNQAENEESGAIYRVLMSDYSGTGTCDWTFIISSSLNNGTVKITSYTSPTSVAATVIQDLANTDATAKWREGYLSDYRGWPQTVQFHQQRLVLGGSDSYPQTIWFGKQDPDDYTNFTEGTLDTSAFTIALEGQNPIRWLLSQDYLIIGTSGSCGKYGEQGLAITPTSPIYQEQTRFGSATSNAIFAGDAILYVERGAKKIRGFDYSLQYDKYITPDLTILSDDITGTGIKEVAFQFKPQPVLWCILNNGDIATLTYQRDQEVTAWSKQITDGNFESVTVISGTDEDEVWVEVLRTIDNSDARYIEQFQPVDWGDNINDAWFVDCGISYNDTATASFTGLDHLEGETVSIYADTLIESTEVVAAGAITIDNAASRVLTGLPFTTKIETLPLAIDPQDKIANKKIRRVWFDLYETGYLKYGNGSSSNLINMNFSNSLEADPAATSQGLYTSTITPKNGAWPYGSMRKQTVYLESSEPMPLCVRSITFDYDMYGN